MIRCENLTAGYGKRQILKDITWEAETGKLTVVVGPNGCGKSTLLKSFMGQTAVWGGGLYLDGRPVSAWSPRETARRVSYVPQSRNDVSLSVSRMVLHGRFPYIVYPRHYTAEDYRKVEWALEKTGISGLGDCLMSELSGGEKQKAYLSMALAQDAPVMILDEPTTYLDISCQLELMELLKGLTEEGKTVIAVLHDLAQGLTYGDRMLVMERGEKAAYGTPEEIFESGQLDRVFGLKIHAGTHGQGGRHYWFEHRK